MWALQLQQTNRKRSIAASFEKRFLKKSIPSKLHYLSESLNISVTETNATILIPDISGFTAFMTNTELGHASRAINMLIEAILDAVGDEYEVSEVLGDAVLLIKKGPAPSKREISATCLRIFHAFHYKRKWIAQHTICPCGACQAMIKLSLKFVVHHGPLAEMKVGRFVMQSGAEMIVAHRLLKNSINNNEYLLMTEKLLQQAADSAESVDMEWSTASDEYDSIGKIDYRFALLTNSREKVPDPPVPDNDYQTDDTPYYEIPIAANFRDAYMEIMNIPRRSDWMPGLQGVEQDAPDVVIGSRHCCKFEDYEAIVSPLRMTFTDEVVFYAESCQIAEMKLSLIHESLFKKTGDATCLFATRFLNAGEHPIPEEVKALLLDRVKRMAGRLKEYCEGKKAV